MINSQDIKNGTCIRLDNRLYFCIEFLHVKPGKGNTFMRTKLKDVVDGRVLERRFNIGEKLEDVRVERRPYQFLYAEGDDNIFMNQETYEQIPIAKDLVTGVEFMKEGDVVEFNKVLLVDADGNVTVGAPTVEGAKVVCEVKTPLVKGEKVLVFKKKRRKGYRRLNGHRQVFTELVIKEVNA